MHAPERGAFYSSRLMEVTEQMIQDIDLCLCLIGLLYQNTTNWVAYKEQDLCLQFELWKSKIRVPISSGCVSGYVLLVG